VSRLAEWGMETPRKFAKVKQHRAPAMLKCIEAIIKDGAEVRPHEDGSATIRYSMKTDSPRWLKHMFYKHGLPEYDKTILELRVNLFSPQKKNG
jgi:hypothetical protein